MGGGRWDIQAGDQRRALDDRSNWCVGLVLKAASSQNRFQRHESNSDVLRLGQLLQQDPICGFKLVGLGVPVRGGLVLPMPVVPMHWPEWWHEQVWLWDAPREPLCYSP